MSSRTFGNYTHTICDAGRAMLIKVISKSLIVFARHVSVARHCRHTTVGYG